VFLDDPSILFNVSHQGDLAVLAGATGCLPGHSLGVDVMKFEYSGGKTLSEFFRIMTRNFSQLVNKQPLLLDMVFKIF
jgi:phosphopantetheinyl transferase